ncbi:patatin-like phospholipase family protein [Aliifodinibius salicampi]|uniref:Patatin-like phospholipase family protein n=1 Tax=Fodinibius salicampi TaxID=1920655 RepID=A0ABT3PWU4_9BACT|nr:patatin-like phospholipase family protein [Fodinibius salicampi]MCW9712331.1 patatin-like phospholipase family protein [Fodinibius salicampi]
MSDNYNISYKTEERTALVLSGGGARGAFQAGVLQVLREQGFTYDVISGISVGSLNGTMMATNQFHRMMKIWEHLTPKQVYRKKTLAGLARRYLQYKIGIGKPPVSQYDNGPLHALMRTHFLGKTTSVPFTFGYVTLETGRYVRATIPGEESRTITEEDIRRILASTAIPAVFNPVPIGDHLCVDGGLRDISPIREVLPYHPHRAIIIPTRPVSDTNHRVESRDIIDIGFRAIHIMLDEIFYEDIARFLTINHLVRQASEEGVELLHRTGRPYQQVHPLIIAPKDPLGDAMDFSNAHIRRMMQTGRDRAREVLSMEPFPKPMVWFRETM